MTRKLYALCGTDKSRPFSPHVWKAKLSLAHKGLTFDVAPVGFTAIPSLEEGGYKDRSPAARRRKAGQRQLRYRALS